MNQHLVVRPAKNGDEEIIDAVGETLTVDVSDLDHVVAHVIQRVDAGAATVLHVEHSFDGVVWVQNGANIVNADLPAGTDTAAERTFSDANGMAMVTKQIRLRCSATDGGEYALKVAGKQRA